ncbi:AMP-binding protein [Paracoccus spongiarum]|uniref:AMP-binding protein n=1 Tax=Paracoccus spongiarum TaxID=3064387 RepID=A0ABT9J9Q3_9RHOB|nr:AMP-binding protein [Paracoccus sp. 2205BS29-5]MDP5306553.1 AMP-binding protein [Paracoccus sp. 2205BS29-5]
MDQQAGFQWRPAGPVTVDGRPLPEDAAGASALARDLVALRGAIRAGAEFSTGPQGVAVVRGGEPGQFRSRSGGTTGPAKAIRRSHASWRASFAVNRDRLGVTGADRYAVPGAPAHSLALYAVVEAADLGAGLDVLAGLGPRAQVRAMAEAGSTILYATPTQLRLLCEAGGALPALRHVLCGGGAMPPGLAARLAALCPQARLRQFYGAAETSFVAWDEGGAPPGSVGRPYPGVELRIADPVDGIGEIWVRSPYLFGGYAEGGSPKTRWQGGFLSVGEMGGLDADGHLRVVGRRSRMVTIADRNVFPEAIEALLAQAPGVTHCAVLPRPCPRRGTVLVAVVAGALDAAAGDALLARCRAAFGPLAAPRALHRLARFPLTVAGKPDLARIARLLEAGQ